MFAVSSAVAELLLADTRAVNRGFRKAWGIGICSVEEVGFFAEPQSAKESEKLARRLVRGNYGGRKVCERLCQNIRQHQRNATLTNSYAPDFSGVKLLREPLRGQVENFVAHLTHRAEKDRSSLLCQLNHYLDGTESAA